MSGQISSGSAVGYLVDGLMLGGFTTGSAEEYRHLNISGQSEGSLPVNAVTNGFALSASFSGASGSLIQAINKAAALAEGNQVLAGNGIAVSGDTVSLDINNGLAQVTIAQADKMSVYDVDASAQKMSTVANVGVYFGSAGATSGVVADATSGKLSWSAAGLTDKGSLVAADVFGIADSGDSGANKSVDGADILGFVAGQVSSDATMTSAGALTIANDAITTIKILDANVTNAKLANSTVTLTGDLGTTSLTLGGSTALTIANDAVTTLKILDANVTNAKLANDGITIAGADTSLGGSITAATIAAEVGGEAYSQTGALKFSKNKLLMTGTDADGQSREYRINVEGGLLRLTISDLA